MAIISFWNNGNEQRGKTQSIAAIATFLAIQHNYKILILDTKYNDYSYHDCYWQEDKTISLIHKNNSRTNVGAGITGLTKAILSNKTSPEIITNYTRIVFSNNRLEILTDTDVARADYDINKTVFKDIAKIASKYYDLVFVDIDNNLEVNIINSLLEVSDLVIPSLLQNLRQINDYLKEKQSNITLKDKATLPLLIMYDSNSKYTIKNVSRYMKEREKVCAIPYNTLYYEACGEGIVDDFFIKFRKINSKDDNGMFMAEVKNTAEKIIYKLQELQMRM